MRAAEAGVVPHADQPESGPRPPRRRALLLNVAIYGLALVALAPFMRLNTSWSVDEGLYVYQVRALQDGHWNLDYWAEPIDPSGRWFFLNRSDKIGDSYFPYVKSPAYPALMFAATKVVGDSIGLHLLPILGALATATAAWLLASQVDRRAAPFAFWIAALGPVAVNAYAIWAHAPSAGVAGFTAYAAVRALRDGLTVGRVAGACAGVAASVLLRTEGVIFAAAVTGVLLIVGGVRVLSRTRNMGRPLFLAGAAATSAVAATMLEKYWKVSISGHAAAKSDYAVAAAGGDVSYLAGKIEGARHVLLDLHYYAPWRPGLSILRILLMVVATFAAGWALTRPADRRSHRVAVEAMGVVIVLLCLRFFGKPDTAPGIIGAWPIAVIGFILFKWRAATLAERVLAGIVVLELLATLATQYPEGGAIEWGARYLSPLYPLIATLAALALFRTFQGVPKDPSSRLVASMLLVLAVLPAVAGLYGQRGYRAQFDRPFRQIEAGRGPVVTKQEWYGQIGHRVAPAHPWLHVELSEIPTALEKLAAAGYQDVIVAEPLDDWAKDPSQIPGGYRVRRELKKFVYLSRS